MFHYSIQLNNDFKLGKNAFDCYFPNPLHISDSVFVKFFQAIKKFFTSKLLYTVCTVENGMNRANKKTAITGKIYKEMCGKSVLQYSCNVVLKA